MNEAPLLTALKGERAPRIPVWFMRQAGRCLPEYRRLRETRRFEELLTHPDLIAEVTLQPVRRLGVDAAILFSDILLLPSLMGMELSYADGQGPSFATPLRGADQLRPLAPERMEFLREGVRLCVEASPVPLIGFCGSPWTVALYLVQGAHEPGFVEARRFLREAPGRFEAILDRLSAASVEWLAAQAEAGAAALQIFDSWGGLLGPADYVRWALPPLVRLVRETRKLFPTIPLILFSKGTGAYLDRILTACPVEAVNPDWSVDLAALRRSPECPRAVQGNLDPALFFAPRAEIRRVVREHIARVGPTGLVLNTGHGLAPTVDPDSVRVAVEAAHEIGGGA